ncbi:MAG: ABC transporter ATP-binding protein, partial [Cyanobacteriota bacterium]|nr:ABC transporter ATP-binding protein [Cyanobacteriota bacterium]
MPASVPTPLLHRARQLALLRRLAREAGWRAVGALALCTGLSSLLDIAGLGLGVSLLLGGGAGAAGRGAAGLRPPLELGLSQGLALLVALVLLRGVLQALIAIGQERLRS